jgi:hypothetical protein
MPLGRATAIVRPAIHGIWMKESTVLCGVQVCNLRTLQKNPIRFFSERFRTTPDSFISKNEGMTEHQGLILNQCCSLGRPKSFYNNIDPIYPGGSKKVRHALALANAPSQPSEMRSGIS